MPVTDVTHDLENRTLTITADFAAPAQRVWEVYADPRQLERVWGPPECPATFVDHSMTPGSRSTYFMSGPQGEKYYGFWDITGVEGPHGFTFNDGFAIDETFTANPELPVSANVFSFSEAEGTTRATFVATYASAEALQQVLAMGVVEGASGAINQIDALLAA